MTQSSQEEPIHIVPYDPSWPARFETEKQLIIATLGTWITAGVHHVGSTAVPGLAAKPIIDIMVGVDNLNDARVCIPMLERIGYCYSPYRPYMHWFCKPSPQRRTHHVHVMEPTDPHWEARLAFRDYLRTHPDTKGKYEQLKMKLAETFRNDREAYTDAKTEFIAGVVSRALRRSY
jgi:GrpB-like predicted nucleotidyltransferase (UPF0157 family)